MGRLQGSKDGGSCWVALTPSVLRRRWPDSDGGGVGGDGGGNEVPDPFQPEGTPTTNGAQPMLWIRVEKRSTCCTLSLLMAPGAYTVHMPCMGSA